MSLNELEIYEDDPSLDSDSAKRVLEELAGTELINNHRIKRRIWRQEEDDHLGVDTAELSDYIIQSRARMLQLLGVFTVSAWRYGLALATIKSPVTARTAYNGMFLRNTRIPDNEEDRILSDICLYEIKLALVMRYGSLPDGYPEN